MRLLLLFVFATSAPTAPLSEPHTGSSMDYLFYCRDKPDTAAKTNVARLVINAARQEQDSYITHNVLAKSEDVSLRLKPQNTDGTGVGIHPLEKIGPPLSEVVEET